ncbi:Helix-hairpin-helix DNA-binding class 1 [Oscillochloris trichoides DG-6]|uniref:Helix-hairpin-helix DNA-binding class 1 n=1 Tax=Oscillochloris trichoides DG-6 TaxID=765420 RepID=E1I9R6_9CHLR|nr:ComEA family DNA-binding protein [Oscillochloris trichoides]EFO82068.1 Helix-hairpin-helix DNA-binding class 1 [Oscillochloris trichoides DG-6]
MSDLAHSWYRRPQLVAAAVCIVLGLLIPMVGPRLRGPAQPPADDLAFTTFAESASLPAPISPAEPTTSPDVIVYISGAVAAPDVYRLPATARVLDLVVAAGGLLPTAASEQINLAAPLSDAQHVHIPRQGDPAAAPAPADVAASSSGGALNLNRASAVDLEELPGIGQALAARIVAYREQQGPFSSVEDLQQVSGIGEALMNQIRPLVTVN